MSAVTYRVSPISSATRIQIDRLPGFDEASTGAFLFLKKEKVDSRPGCGFARLHPIGIMIDLWSTGRCLFEPGECAQQRRRYMLTVVDPKPGSESLPHLHGSNVRLFPFDSSPGPEGMPLAFLIAITRVCIRRTFSVRFGPYNASAFLPFSFPVRQQQEFKTVTGHTMKSVSVVAGLSLCDSISGTPSDALMLTYWDFKPEAAAACSTSQIDYVARLRSFDSSSGYERVSKISFYNRSVIGGEGYL
ncbi:hypothetical protein C8R44DRAFT_740159 [Mycena epipterygia]|nr:hypothetical protein C8R44DRAFT_740159 [Mycena epipterygia]